MNETHITEIRNHIESNPDAMFTVFPQFVQTVSHRVFGAEMDLDSFRIEDDEILVTLVDSGDEMVVEW